MCETSPLDFLNTGYVVEFHTADYIHYIKRLLVFAFKMPVRCFEFTKDVMLERSNPLERRREYLILQLFHVFTNPHVANIASRLENLSFYWRSFPDAFVNHKEMRRVVLRFIRRNSNVHVEEVCDNFQKCGFEGCADVLQPRSLAHYSRCVVRRALSRNSQMPKGIAHLGLPSELQRYLRLEY